MMRHMVMTMATRDHTNVNLSSRADFDAFMLDAHKDRDHRGFEPVAEPRSDAELDALAASQRAVLEG